MSKRDRHGVRYQRRWDDQQPPVSRPSGDEDRDHDHHYDSRCETCKYLARPSGDEALRAALKEARDYLASGSGVVGVIAFIDRALATPSSAPPATDR